MRRWHYVRFILLPDRFTDTGPVNNIGIPNNIVKHNMDLEKYNCSKRLRRSRALTSHIEHRRIENVRSVNILQIAFTYKLNKISVIIIDTYKQLIYLTNFFLRLHSTTQTLTTHAHSPI